MSVSNDNGLNSLKWNCALPVKVDVPKVSDLDLAMRSNIFITTYWLSASERTTIVKEIGLPRIEISTQ